MRRFLLCLIAVAAVATFAMPWAGARTAPAVPGPRAAVALPKPFRCRRCYRPALRTSWQWQLQFKVDTSFDVRMYDIDGFDASKALVAKLHHAGRKLVCYVDVGSWESWRPDAKRFPAAVKGRSNGWPGERWLDIRRLDILGPIMQQRLDMCATKGFDAVEFDNVDGYTNDTGFPLTGAQQLRYDVFLANQAHRRGMSAVLKNDLGQIPRLLPYFDFALDEQCHQYRECAALNAFVNAGKAVFGVEYRLTKPAFCPASDASNFNFLKKRLALGPWRSPCRPDHR
jgi:hypothetical protein